MSTKSAQAQRLAYAEERGCLRPAHTEAEEAGYQQMMVELDAAYRRDLLYWLALHPDQGLVALGIMAAVAAVLCLLLS